MSNQELFSVLPIEKDGLDGIIENALANITRLSQTRGKTVATYMAISEFDSDDLVPDYLKPRVKSVIDAAVEQLIMRYAGIPELRDFVARTDSDDFKKIYLGLALKLDAPFRLVSTNDNNGETFVQYDYKGSIKLSLEEKDYCRRELNRLRSR